MRTIVLWLAMTAVQAPPATPAPAAPRPPGLGAPFNIVGLFSGEADEVVELWEGGAFSHSRHQIYAIGRGSPPTKAQTIAAARLAAEDSARGRCLDGLLDTLGRITYDSERHVQDLVQATAPLRAALQALLARYRTVETRYFADGGVDTAVMVSVDATVLGALGMGHTPPSAGVAPGPVTPVAPTGVVINAKGLGLQPALAPRLLDVNGQVVWDTAFIPAPGAAGDDEAGRGTWPWAVSYGRALEAALHGPRVGARPLVLRAQGATGSLPVNVVLSAQDAERLQVAKAALAEGRLTLVVDDRP